MTWRDDAACRGEDPALFFPPRGDVQAMNTARAICAGCPVREACREEHLDEREGVWGGLSKRQRRLERRQRRVA